MPVYWSLATLQLPWWVDHHVVTQHAGVRLARVTLCTSSTASSSSVCVGTAHASQWQQGPRLQWHSRPLEQLMRRVYVWSCFQRVHYLGSLLGRYVKACILRVPIASLKGSDPAAAAAVCALTCHVAGVNGC